MHNFSLIADEMLQEADKILQRERGRKGGKQRWANATEEERKRHIEKMNLALKKKREELKTLDILAAKEYTEEDT